MTDEPTPEERAEFAKIEAEASVIFESMAKTYRGSDPRALCYAMLQHIAGMHRKVPAELLDEHLDFLCDEIWDLTLQVRDSEAGIERLSDALH